MYEYLDKYSIIFIEYLNYAEINQMFSLLNI